MTMSHKSMVAVPVCAAAMMFLGGLLTSPEAKAATGDSPEITRLLAEVNDQAIQFRADSDKMAAFTRSNISADSYAQQLQTIKEHVNAAGKAVAKLNEQRADGSPWQQTAIDRLNPMFRELVTNTETVINALNKNRSRVHMKEFQDYVQANADVSADLARVISDFVDYGNAKTKLERLAAKLEIEEQ